MYRLLKDTNVPKKAKQIIHQTSLRHILIFGSECWTLTKRLEQQITTADMKVIRMIQGVIISHRERDMKEYLYRHAAHCSSDQQEQRSMVWQCHEERGRVNPEGCNEDKEEGKETKTKVARQHRWPPERKEHITEISPRNEIFRESKRLEDITFLIN